jgi:hypothetical protein
MRNADSVPIARVELFCLWGPGNTKRGCGEAGEMWAHGDMLTDVLNFLRPGKHTAPLPMPTA